MTRQRPVSPPGCRIVVIGPSNSGKSTVGRQLATALDVPFIEMDALNWRPGWTPAPEEKFAAALDAATAGDKWVAAGSYRRVAHPIVWPRADCIVWLDLPLRVVLPRLLRRSWRRWRTRELLWGTNTEQIWKHLKLWSMTDSLLAFQLRTHRPRRKRNEADMADPRWSHIRFIRLRSPAAVEAFMRDVGARTRTVK